MEERCSASSPRSIPSFSKRTDSSFSGTNSPPPTRSIRDSSKRGPNLSEVYGFVGSIAVVASIVIFIIWAYVPDYWLHSVGIYYYPSRYWALAVPTYVMVTIVLAIGFYIGMNFMATPPPTSLNTMFDEYSEEPVSGIPSRNEDEDELGIEPISDIGINQVDAMFK